MGQRLVAFDMYVDIFPSSEHDSVIETNIVNSMI